MIGLLFTLWPYNEFVCFTRCFMCENKLIMVDDGRMD